jgi:RES domain-containing protein
VVAYASSSLSLATLEYLAHIDREDVPTDIIRVSVAFEDSDVETMREPYPGGWNQVAPPAAARRFGDDWVRQSRSLVLAVPSMIVPLEANFLINPSHPRRVYATVGEIEDYPLDARLI